jgi:hypothetical protein
MNSSRDRLTFWCCIAAEAAGSQIILWKGIPVYWRLQFRRNVLLGHVLFCIGEMSLFFVNALAVVVLLDRFVELQFVLWKVIVLLAILFAICCYKHQLATVGELMIESEFKTVPKET